MNKGEGDPGRAFEELENLFGIVHILKGQN